MVRLPWCDDSPKVGSLMDSEALFFPVGCAVDGSRRANLMENVGPSENLSAHGDKSEETMDGVPMRGNLAKRDLILKFWPYTSQSRCRRLAEPTAAR